ncbi:MAG: DUF305 domain-containing protein [Gemmatimonadota bacterium]|nr:DUF305 domain-containing protein [Gemmatimonadota bacterium]
MASLPIRRRIAGPLFVALMTAGLTAGRADAQAAAKKDYTPADADFMQMMIMHHAQAVVMSDWAATHGARSDVLVLCQRIALSQRDEITLMQHWLEARGLSAPDPLRMNTPHAGPVVDSSPMHMPGMDMGPDPMLMDGMLTPAQMRALDAARGVAFDRLYLTGMIKHHEGALKMVAALFATPGGGQQPELSGYAADIDAGQRAEIGRMQAMLQTLPTSTSPTR